MQKNKDSIDLDKQKRNVTSDKDKMSNVSTDNSVGPTRRYVSGDEEKSSSSHQFHKT